MVSWQTHLTVLGLKWQVKRRMRPDADLVRVRTMLSGFPRKLPAGVEANQQPVGGIPGEWLNPSTTAPIGTMLYLHGGGYFACSPQTHRPITARFARAGLRVFSPDYRLAPEHPFPAAIDDAVASYRGLIVRGIDPRTIVVAGDSAGGGLALATLLSLRDAGDPLPAAAVLFSPWTDLAGTGGSLRTNHKRDAMFPGQGMQYAAAPYLAGTDPRNPLASPLYAELAGLPPMLVHVGSYEILLDDSRRLVERARQAGVAATLEMWPVVPHVWQLFPLPEAEQSMGKAVDYLKLALRSKHTAATDT